MPATKLTRNSGCWTTPRFAKLRPALRNWVDIIDEWVRADDGVPPYLYCSPERVNCGLLSAAMWRARVPNLQEPAVNRSDNSLGRADLNFFLGGEEYYIEAKMCGFALDALWDARSILATILERLKSTAAGAHKKYVSCRDDRWIALTFVVPSIGKEHWRKPKLRAQILREFIKALKPELVKADFAAWTFPRGIERWDECLGDGRKHYHPAIAIVGKRARKPRSRSK